MPDENSRSRVGRAAAEAALVRVVHYYGSCPEFVVLGGLIPELLCLKSSYQHAGTTDIDVQVDLEIACGSVNTKRLEQALQEAGFTPTSERVWRWIIEEPGTPRVEVKFELLADLDSRPSGDILSFDECNQLGAVNLRGTRFAARDKRTIKMSAEIKGSTYRIEVNVADIAGFLLAKTAAAYSRRLPKDWYDIAFVLLNNDIGGPNEVANLVLQKFGRELVGEVQTALKDLAANFESHHCQGALAFSEQFLIDHPDLDEQTVRADAIVAVTAFYKALYP